MKKIISSIILIFILTQESIAVSPDTKVVIYPEDRYGNVLEYLIYDLKLSMGDINSTDKAERFFNLYDMNGVRISIYGNEGHRYHPEAGSVLYDADAQTGYYKLVNSVKHAQNARNGKDFVVFASKKLKNVVSWPEWVLDNGGPEILSDEYATMLYDYVQFMYSHGIEIDILGLDNEERWNQADISASQYKEIIDKLMIKLNYDGFKIPLWMGYEDYDPNLRSWVSNLMNNGWKDYMDIYGVHYYPNTRKLTALQADLSKIEDIPFWSTEAHWSSKADQDQLLTAEIGMTTLWDQTDEGLDGLCMWDFRKTETDLRFNLVKETMIPLKDAQPIFTDDMDGISIDASNYGKQLFTRSFIEDNLVTVYAINMTSAEFTSQEFEVNFGDIQGNVSYVQFTDDSPVTGNYGVAQKHTNGKGFLLSLPSRSVTRFSIQLAPLNIIKLECEDLNYTSSSAFFEQTNSIAASNKHVNLYSDSEGDAIQFSFDISEEGLYNLSLTGLTWETMAEYKCEISTDSINWQELEGTIDLYGTESSRKTHTWNNISFISGVNHVRYTSVGKNENATSYKGSFDYFVLEKSTNTALESTKHLTDFRLFPNPVNSTLKVQGLSPNTPVNIYTVTGTQILQTCSQQIDVSNLPQGQYILKANSKAKMFIKL